MSSGLEEGMASARWRSWFLAILIAAGLIAAVAHWGEVRRFAALLREAEPGWIGLALVLQLTTYASVAGGWAAVLRRARTPQPLRPLMRIALTKLFADQVLPSAGMGGNILLVDQLRALGVPKGTAVAALGMLTLSLTGRPLAVVAGAVLLGAGFGVAQNASLTLMFDQVTAAGYDMVSAIWNLAYDAGMGLGAAGFGAVAVRTGYSGAFALTGALMLMALVAPWRDRAWLEADAPSGS